MARQPWHRRKGETKQAYAAFCAYYRMPSRERSIYGAWLAIADEDQVKRGREDAPRHWYRWSSEHEWVARAAAYDDYLAEQDRLLWEERRRRLRERDWEQAEALRDIVAQALPHAEQFIRRKTTTIPGNAKAGIPDREIVTLEFDITALSRVLTDASKLQRLTTDEPTEHVELSGAALDAYIAAQLERLAHGAETGAGHAAAPDTAGTGTDLADAQ